MRRTDTDLVIGFEGEQPFVVPERENGMGVSEHIFVVARLIASKEHGNVSTVELCRAGIRTAWINRECVISSHRGWYLQQYV